MGRGLGRGWSCRIWVEAGLERTPGASMLEHGTSKNRYVATLLE